MAAWGILKHFFGTGAGREEYDLADKYFNQQKYAEAELLYRQSAQERERVLGTEHRDTIVTRVRLAASLSQQEKNTEAELLSRQLQPQLEKFFGTEHLATINNRYAIAHMLAGQEKYSEAETFFRQSVQERERVLGVEHLDTLESRYFLAKTLLKQDKYLEAEPLLRQSAQERKRVLGSKHQDTLKSKILLASTLVFQEKFLEAEPLLTECNHEHEQVHGAEHQDTLNSKVLLARTLLSQEKYIQAEPLFHHLVQQLEKVRGVEHVETLNSKYLLVGILYFQEKYNEAEMLGRQLTQQQEKELGAKHENTLGGKSLLATILHHERKYDESEQLFRLISEQQKDVLGVDHADTISSRANLALSLGKQQRYAEAEPLLRRSIQQLENVRGTEHEITLEGKYDLAEMLYDQQKYAEAEELLQQSVQQRKVVLGEDHKDTRKSEHLLRNVLLAMAPTVSTHPKTESILSRLGSFFVESEETRLQYTDSEISQICFLLGHINSQWGKVPRTYIILRTIGCSSLIDTFIDHGFSDYLLPVTERSLPSSLQARDRPKFLAAQNLVMTKSMHLEKGENGQHRHFRGDERLPFEEKGILGAGGFGQVDRVLSLISFKEYARKRVPRNSLSSRRKEDVQRFIAEIEILKRLKHDHIVDFVGSYTDPKYIALIMSPVADMDLATYLFHADSSKHGELRTYFGCLARALEFLHERNIRHKDIKPGNILVCQGNVLFTDFGLSYDFSDAEGSTTVSMVRGLTPRYCSPEVAMQEPRNTSSDMWSLGIVFLEMIAVLKCRTVESVHEFFKSHGTQEAYVRSNFAAFNELVAELRETGRRSDNIVLSWVQEMLVVQPQQRPTAVSLVASITAAGRDGEEAGTFCGICCASSDDELPDDYDDLEDISIQ
jgi:tetratricopeptide (TPR) repeat protein